MALTLYLSELNQLNTAIGTDGTFTGISTGALTGTDTTIYCQMPIANWLAAFKFKTDNSVDAAVEGVELQVLQANNLISNAASVINTSNTVTGMYGEITFAAAAGAEYASHTIKDRASSSTYASNGAAKMHFLQELSRAVFGTTSAVDLFTNEAALATAYGTAIETCATNINALFASGGSSVLVDTIATYTGTLTSAQKVLLAAKKIYDQMRYTVSGSGTPLSRFSMMYGAVPTSGVTSVALGNLYIQYTGPSGTARHTAMTQTNGNLSSGVLKGEVVASAVTQLYVTTAASTTGGDWLEGDKVTFYTEQAFTNARIEIAALTDVQAKMLNGDLNTATSLPFIVGDIFQIQLSINNKNGQINSAGNALANNQVNSTVNLSIKLA